MILVESRGKVPIRLTTERWAHIIAQHPEMATQRERVVETVKQPEMIQAGDSANCWRYASIRRRP